MSHKSKNARVPMLRIMCFEVAIDTALMALTAFEITTFSAVKDRSLGLYIARQHLISSGAYSFFEHCRIYIKGDRTYTDL